MTKRDYEPCPWCGRRDMELRHSLQWGCFVRCPHCNAVGPNKNTPEGAKAAWDRRAEPLQGRMF